MARKAWETVFWSAGTSALADLFATPATQAPVAASGFAGSLYMVTPAAIEASDSDKIVPIRMIGDVHIGALSATGEGIPDIWIKERIHVGIETPEGVSCDESLFDPTSPSEDFLWERTRCAQPVISNANDQANITLGSADTTYQYHIDLKVSRRLEPPMVLLYTVCAAPDNVGDLGRLRAWGWMRMYLSR